MALISFGVMADDASEAILRKRSADYWEAWKINDRQTAFKMESAMVKGKLTPDQYQSPLGPRMRLVGYKISNIKVDGNTASLSVDLSLTLPGLAGKSFEAPTIREQWSLINGQWFHGALDDKGGHHQ